MDERFLCEREHTGKAGYLCASIISPADSERKDNFRDIFLTLVSYIFSILGENGTECSCCMMVTPSAQHPNTHMKIELAQWLAWWAHNPQVPGSKPGFDNYLIFFGNV